MTKNKGIFIKNIYYMLTYAFQVLKQSQYESISAEKFEEIADLFAALLAKGISKQLKQGLYREYLSQITVQPMLRGKLHLQQTLLNQFRGRSVFTCESDELSENHILNQILKTTSQILIQDPSVSIQQKNALRKNMLFFHNVETVQPAQISWNRLHFHQNNKNYQMLMNLCYFVLNNLLQTTENGHYRMATFSEEHIEKLFEKFVLEYFKRHFPNLRAASSQIVWDVEHATESSMIQFLPRMQTDITLKYQQKTLIIDTKYYTHIMQSNFNSNKIRSNHLYQIFAYVKNADTQNTGNVSGLLLYAKTEKAVLPNCEYLVGGNSIGIKTLDLNTDFSAIASQLDQIIADTFGISQKEVIT